MVHYLYRCDACARPDAGRRVLGSARGARAMCAPGSAVERRAACRQPDTRALKRCAQAAGLDPALYSAESLRAGPGLQNALDARLAFALAVQPHQVLGPVGRLDATLLGHARGNTAGRFVGRARNANDQ